MLARANVPQSKMGATVALFDPNTTILQYKYEGILQEIFYEIMR
jgi:hypothetical protein